MANPTYVPLLRWKQAERLALRDLSPVDADTILPLAEVVPKFIADGNLVKLPDQLNDAWGARQILLDGAPPEFRDTDQAATVFAAIASHAGSISVGVTPVVTPRDHAATISGAASVVAAFRNGVALRAHPTELGSVVDFAARLGLPPREIDLVVDFGIVGSQSSARYSRALALLPIPAEWRRVIFLGGAFPPDLTSFAVGQHLLPRHDWRAWQGIAESDAVRRPAFGDYTIQHPAYSEPVPFSNFSASIRYASSEDWVIMRGEGVRNAGGAGYAQWPANAQLLRERPEFCGPAFSAGDRYVEVMGTEPRTTGNASSWLRAGVNHHITMACRQSASRS
jgi:hypothetical protein